MKPIGTWGTQAAALHAGAAPATTSATTCATTSPTAPATTSAPAPVLAQAQLPVAAPWLLAVALLLPLLAYLHTAASIADIWARSDTYAHGYLIAPISLWLIWRARARWLRLPPQPAWAAFGPLLLCGAVWLLARLASVQVACQLAVVAMLPLAVWLLLGTAIARALAFPLGLLLLAVPVGDSLIEPLMQLTANWTVAGLRLSGIPVLHEGNNFTLPTGSWSVIEACSGLRYLMASITLGCLYAYLTYRSLLRRALFVLAAVLVPLLANWLRAYLIVLLGHLTDMRQAGGIDHVLYGWLFFGVMMMAMLAAGNRWRQTPLPLPALAPAAQPHAAPPVRALLPAGVALIIALAVWPAWAAHLQRGAPPDAPVGLQAFQADAAAGSPFTDWQPAHTAPAAHLQRWYQVDGAPLGLSVLYYRHQHDASKLISSANRLVAMTDPARHLDGVGRRHVNLAGGRTLQVVESTVRGAGGPLLVWQWYAIDGRATASDTLGKVLQAGRALRTGGNDDGAAILVYTPQSDLASARSVLRDFVAANIGRIDATLASVGNQRGDLP